MTRIREEEDYLNQTGLSEVEYFSIFTFFTFDSDLDQNVAWYRQLTFWPLP